MIVTPGPVINFLLTNQNVRDIRDIDWPKVHIFMPPPDTPDFVSFSESTFLAFIVFS
jgi:hypothetical protein